MSDTKNVHGRKTGNGTAGTKGGFSLFQGLVNIISGNNEKASEMVANMEVGSNAVSSVVDSMNQGINRLDKIWKGDTKEAFVGELNELRELIKQNAGYLQDLARKIENENKITETQQQESYKDANDLYYEKL